MIDQWVQVIVSRKGSSRNCRSKSNVARMRKTSIDQRVMSSTRRFGVIRMIEFDCVDFFGVLRGFCWVTIDRKEDRISNHVRKKMWLFIFGSVLLDRISPYSGNPNRITRKPNKPYIDTRKPNRIAYSGLIRFGPVRFSVRFGFSGQILIPSFEHPFLIKNVFNL